MRFFLFFITAVSFIVSACGGRPAYEYNTLAEVCASADTLCEPVVIENTVYEPVEIPVYYPEHHIVGNFPPILFAPNSTEIAGEYLCLLKEIARVSATADIKLLLIGHADERRSSDYNFELALARANATKLFLIKHGVSPDAINVESRGETQSVANCHNEECWRLNRRVEINTNGSLFEKGE